MLRTLPSRRAATLVEFLVVFAIIVVCMLLLWPVIAPTRHGHPVSCLSNAKQINTALMMYLQDYDDRLPPFANGVPSSPNTFPSLVHPYLKNRGIWRCPRDKREEAGYDGTPGDTTVDYGYNWLALSPTGEGVLMKDVRDPAETVSVVETSSYLAVPAPLAGGFGGSAPSDRHEETVVVAWLDGHVKRMRHNQLNLMADSENGQPLGQGIDGFRYWNLK